MLSVDIKKAISLAFEHIPLEAFTFLDANSQCKLKVSESQSPTGDEIVEKVVKRKVSIYVMQANDEEMLEVGILCIGYLECYCSSCNYSTTLIKAPPRAKGVGFTVNR